MSQPTLKIIENASELPAADWDGLTDGDPTLSHAFFLALQESGCAMPKFGWQAQFITLWQGTGNERNKKKCCDFQVENLFGSILARGQ